MAREPHRASRPPDLDVCAVVRRAQCQAQVLEDLAVQAQGLALAAEYAAGRDTSQRVSLAALAAEAQAMAVRMASAACESRARLARLGESLSALLDAQSRRRVKAEGASP